MIETQSTRIDHYETLITALYTGPLRPIKYTKNTMYCPLDSYDGPLFAGVTHHEIGLGKLKINDGIKEYGVPITDIINKPLDKWRIELNKKQIK